MKKFTLKADITRALIPGVGQVKQGTVIEGDEYGKYCPSLLTEVPSEPTMVPETKKAAPARKQITEPSPAIPPPPPVPTMVNEVLPHPKEMLTEPKKAEPLHEDTPKRSPGRPKKVTFDE